MFTSMCTMMNIQITCVNKSFIKYESCLESILPF